MNPPGNASNDHVGQGFDPVRDPFHTGNYGTIATIALMQVSPRKSSETSAAPSPEVLARQLVGFIRYAWSGSDSEFTREVAEQDLSFSQLKTLLLVAEHAG